MSTNAEYDFIGKISENTSQCSCILTKKQNKTKQKKKKKKKKNVRIEVVYLSHEISRHPYCFLWTKRVVVTTVSA